MPAVARPTVVLAMVPQLTSGLFTPTHHARLAAIAEVPECEPLTVFGDARAAHLLARAEILLTGWGCPPIDAATLAQAPRLRAIVHAAGTVKDHVTEAAWQRGLLVSSAAAANAVPVAEYTVAAILLANKRALFLRERYRAVREFRWWPREAPGLGNYGKVVGLVGASAVGRAVIERLRRFDLELLVADPYLAPSDAAQLGVELVELDALLARADVVSLHAPALPETRHLLDARRLGLMRDGATLLNTARGWLVDHAALERELVAGRLHAVLDTTEPEILPADSPLYDLPNVFLTPHIAGAMGAETQRLATHAIDEIERYARGEPFRHPVRREDLPRLA
ncbi:MAG: hydroxyacid dehydrogenase [Deltaproteobacteria bacterium]|nr:hydroxyacid dehydrogenase [Deltaproteobacteria bacterium]